MTMTGQSMETVNSSLFQSNRAANFETRFVSGYIPLSFPTSQFTYPSDAYTLPAAAGTSTIINLSSGAVATGATVTYYGLPVIGFAAQSFSAVGLPGVPSTTLSNYGGTFLHKAKRRVSIQAR